VHYTTLNQTGPRIAPQRRGCAVGPAGQTARSGTGRSGDPRAGRGPWLGGWPGAGRCLAKAVGAGRGWPAPSAPVGARGRREWTDGQDRAG